MLHAATRRPFRPYRFPTSRSSRSFAYRTRSPYPARRRRAPPPGRWGETCRLGRPRKATHATPDNLRARRPGEMAERLNAAVLKTAGPSRGSWVRIPLSPRVPPMRARLPNGGRNARDAFPSAQRLASVVRDRGGRRVVAVHRDARRVELLDVARERVVAYRRTASEHRSAGLFHGASFLSRLSAADSGPCDPLDDRERAQTPVVKFVVAGGSGHLGTLLVRARHAAGDEVVVLSRAPRAAPWRVEVWDAKTLGPWATELDGADVVVNMAGRSVNCRYTPENRRAIMDSRVHSTRVLGEAIAQLSTPPRLWMNSSTATIYRHSLDRPMDEQGDLGGHEPNVPDTWRFSID